MMAEKAGLPDNKSLYQKQADSVKYREKNTSWYYQIKMERGNSMKTAILIPAYEPDEKLVDLVHELSNLQFPIIMVVDDGSSKKCDNIFSSLEEIPCCTVVHHNINRGKGAALKTGIKSLLSMNEDILGCITADADGQHLPEDILKTAEIFERNSDNLILGCRNFGAGNVPLKSRLGNLLTRTVFKFSTGKSITDTQTGLRAVPVNLMRRFMELPGDHYEFEMNMLMQAARSNITIEEVMIHTVYINRNKASHFNPLLDSIRIYREILKFSFSSILCSIIDIGLFSLMFWLLSSNNIPRPLLGATVIARMASSGINFTLNKRVVFRNSEAALYQVAKYYLLCGIQMLGSWLLLEGLTLLVPGYVVMLKIFVDTLLFFISFGIQRRFIFGRSVSHEKNAGIL